jgi:hypothetical protein
MLYPTRPAITRTRITLGYITEYYSIILSVDIGETSNNLYVVSQKSVVV